MDRLARAAGGGGADPAGAGGAGPNFYLPE